jgi:DNA-binding transcriptional MerR regulator
MPQQNPASTPALQHEPAPAPSSAAQITLSSGELAMRCQLSRGALRLYERQGLIQPSQRSASGYRIFDEQTVTTLNAIRVAQQAGFTLAEIGEMMRLIDPSQFSATHVSATLRQKSRSVEDKIKQLQTFKRFLDRVAATPEILLDPECDILLELAMLDANQPARPRRAASGSSSPKPVSKPSRS